MTEFSQGPAMWQAIVAILIFAAAYVSLLIEKWNRTYTVLGGALLMVLLGILPIGKAFTVYANWHALILIASLFIISGIFQKTGLIAYTASAIIHKFRLQPFTILLGFSILAALTSALLDALIAVAVIVPVVLKITKMMKLSPVPFLISFVISANIGGAATLLGNIPNRMVGAVAHVTMGHFLIALAPLVVIMLGILYVGMWLLYGKHMVIADSYKKEPINQSPASYLTNDRVLLLGGSLVAVLTLVAFVLQGWLGWNASYIGAGGAVALLALDYKGIVSLAKDKDYRTVLQSFMDSQILYFFGLFMMVGGLAYAGVSGFIAARGLELSQGSVSFLSMLVLWLTSFGSAMMDNIPYIAAMIPVIGHAGEMLSSVSQVPITPLWWSLLIGSAIGGSATWVGSTTGMFAAGLAEQEGVRVSQRDYIIVAAPFSFLLLIVATIYFRVFLL
ncbi:SLC13 family permease [Paenibacillus sp. GCM10027628]|uniref:SLC13 family permease n=1 Tax=Paenibacillus sp. GCM10027628 TaxID=3273413 RepID=UPI00363516D8